MGWTEYDSEIRAGLCGRVESEAYLACTESPHEIANHPHINFYQFSQPHIHNNAPPTSFHKNTRKQKKPRWHFLNPLQSNSHPHTFSSAADRSCSHQPTRRCRSACCTTTSATS